MFLEGGSADNRENNLYWGISNDIIGVILGLYKGYIGVILRLYSGYIRFILAGWVT